MRDSTYAINDDPGEIPSPWAVVRTKPNQERVAMANLEMRDVELYCPEFCRRHGIEGAKGARSAVPLLHLCSPFNRAHRVGS